MVDAVEELLQVHVHHHPCSPACDVALRRQHRAMRASSRPKAVAVLAEGRVDQRLQHLQQRLLDQPVRHRRDAQFALAAARLRDLHAGAPAAAGTLPSSSCCADVGPVRSSGTRAVSSMVSPSTPALPLLALTRFHAAAMFVACQRPAPAARSCPRRPCSCRAGDGFIAAGSRAASPCALRSARPSLRGLLMPVPVASVMSSSTAPSRSALRPGRSGQLLRPLLTSRSGSSPSPFQAQGEISPGKNAILHRTTAGFTPPGLGHESFAVTCPLALLGAASYPVLVHRPAVSLHASFPRSVALTQLRFASLAVASSREDLHLQDRAHAGRTRKRTSGGALPRRPDLCRLEPCAQGGGGGPGWRGGPPPAQVSASEELQAPPGRPRGSGAARRGAGDQSEPSGSVPSPSVGPTRSSSSIAYLAPRTWASISAAMSRVVP